MNNTRENSYLKFGQLASMRQCYSHKKSTINLETLISTYSKNLNASHYYFLVCLHYLWGHCPISYLPMWEPGLVEWYEEEKGWKFTGLPLWKQILNFSMRESKNSVPTTKPYSSTKILEIEILLQEGCFFTFPIDTWLVVNIYTIQKDS